MQINLKDYKYQIFDDMIPKEDADKLEHLFLDGNFPWYFKHKGIDDNDDKQDYFFDHVFVMNGNVNSLNYIDRLGGLLLENIPPTEEGVDRIKANFSPRAIHETIGIKHHDIDVSIPSYVGLYYVNDSDGDTILYEDDNETEMVRITPKKGRIVFFRGDILHSAGIPQKSDYRIVVNLNILSNREDLGK
tara:strand:- start:137 stop:703 length:567 start_codon:yes stop_codon:yes gene_type:complete